MAGKRGGALPAPFTVRFWSKAEMRGPDECWPWTGALNDSGYGVILGDDRKLVYAHRVTFERFAGPVPDGFEVDHTCRNRACVNPRHLQAVTHLENIRRGVERRRVA